MHQPTIEEHMVHEPLTIGRDQTLATAHRMMRTNDLRHLPVLDGGELVGLLSERDLYFMESFPGTDPGQVTVEDAMSPDPLAFGPKTPLAEVVKAMAKGKYGSALIVAGRKVVGIFTATDALALLSRLLGGDEPGARPAAAR
jgi:acetoin utilization protein AcuB